MLLKGRLAAALRKLNLRDGQPWLDDARIARAIRDLEQAAGHRLMEVNQSATELLLKGTVVDGLPDWDQGRPQPVRFIDFENPANNDFLVINQFKVELTSGRGHVIPDAVLFVNGIPLVVAEFKSPGIENPLQEAINQLLRYSNQRRELCPTLYTENEGVERLFHTNQLLIASDFFEARAATIGAPPEAYLEWADTSPVPLSTVAEELGVLPASPTRREAARELAALGPEQTDRAGHAAVLPQAGAAPEALRRAGRDPAQPADSGRRHVAPGASAGPDPQLHGLPAGGRQDAQGGGALPAVPRHPQGRRAPAGGPDASQGAERDERGGIIWHTQGSGKSLSMVFLVRKMRMTPRLNRFKIVVVTDRTDLEDQLRETAQLQRRSRCGRTTTTSSRASRPRPDAAHPERGNAGHRLRHAPEISGRRASRRRGGDKVAMTIVRKEKKPGKDEAVVEKEVTFKENIHFEEFPGAQRVGGNPRAGGRGAPLAHAHAAPQSAQGAAQRGHHRLYRHPDPQPGEERDARRSSATSSTSISCRTRNWTARPCRFSTKAGRRMAS